MTRKTITNGNEKVKTTNDKASCNYTGIQMKTYRPLNKQTNLIPSTRKGRISCKLHS